MQTEQELIGTFLQDGDKIIKDLINSYGLKHEEEVGNLSDPMLRWFDFVHRYIKPKPREVFYSNRFPKKLVTEASTGLQHLKEIITAGGDINPYQSKGLILHNDSSGSKRQQRTDFLWADWGIHHLHLTITPVSPSKYFADRSQWLLFCIVGDDFVGLVDVRDHNEPDLFSNPDLINAVADSWPEVMERFRMKGVLPPAQGHSAGEISSLRKGGVSTFITVNNQVYMAPGMGITTASTPLRVSLSMDRVRAQISELASLVFRDDIQFRAPSISAGVPEPEYGLALTPQGLVVHERKADKAFILPRDGGSFLAELHNLLAPQWAIDFVIKQSSTSV